MHQGQEVGTKLGAATFCSSFPSLRKGGLIVTQSIGLPVSPAPTLVQDCLWLPLGMGSVPSLWLCLSLTRMPCYLSSSARSPSLSCPGSFLALCPCLGALPSLLPSPLLAISGPSQTEAEVGEYHSFLCPPSHTWDELGDLLTPVPISASLSPPFLVLHGHPHPSPP